MCVCVCVRARVCLCVCACAPICVFVDSHTVWPSARTVAKLSEGPCEHLARELECQFVPNISSCKRNDDHTFGSFAQFAITGAFVKYARRGNVALTSSRGYLF